MNAIDQTIRRAGHQYGLRGFGCIDSGRSRLMA